MAESAFELIYAAHELAREHALDYSEASLERLPPLVAPIVAPYFGEVLCRNLGGVWLPFDPDPVVRVEAIRTDVRVFAQGPDFKNRYLQIKADLIGVPVSRVTLSSAPPRYRRHVIVGLVRVGRRPDLVRSALESAGIPRAGRVVGNAPCGCRRFDDLAAAREFMQKIRSAGGAAAARDGIELMK